VHGIPPPKGVGSHNVSFVNKIAYFPARLLGVTFLTGVSVARRFRPAALTPLARPHHERYTALRTVVPPVLIPPFEESDHGGSDQSV
jgi:hypothetical protein